MAIAESKLLELENYIIIASFSTLTLIDLSYPNKMRILAHGLKVYLLYILIIEKRVPNIGLPFNLVGLNGDQTWNQETL